jgi:ADP-ribose pyrophosphatase YjhB (NUDIX family)
VDFLTVAQRIRNLAQAGLAYSEGPFDRDRYQQLLALAAEILATSTGTSLDDVTEILRLERGYPTPKVDVRAVVPRGDQLLFVRETTDGRWALPGGWADSGTPPGKMAAREVLEETGYVVTPLKVLAVFDKATHLPVSELWGVYKLFFLCRIDGGEARPSFETPELGFFGENEIPPLSLNRNTESQVRRMFEHVRAPQLATDFD